MFQLSMVDMLILREKRKTKSALHNNVVAKAKKLLTSVDNVFVRILRLRDLNSCFVALQSPPPANSFISMNNTQKKEKNLMYQNRNPTQHQSKTGAFSKQIMMFTDGSESRFSSDRPTAVSF
jgi:hypothetical protein